MASFIFLWVAPLTCFIIFCLYTVSSLLWDMFSRIDYKTSNNVNTNTQVAASCLFLTSIYFFIFIIIVPSQLNAITGLIRLQLLFAIGSVLASFTLQKASMPSIDYLVFCIFIALSSFFLLTSYNFITIFFTLELLNMLIIYSFFFNANSTRLANSASALKISSSCIYQFILNFFSSIILFWAINYFISLTGGSSLSNTPLWQLNTSVQWAVTITLFAFLLKLGTGPWVFFKIVIYKNMNFLTVFLYTSVYLITILIFFVNLVFIYNLNLNIIGRYVMVLIPAIATLGFAGLAFHSGNFFIFLSFSSLINLTVFILQIICLV